MTHNKILIDSADKIIELKNYVMCLRKKLAFLRFEYATKTEKEKNDIAIEEYETYMMIRKCERKVADMKRIFETQILNPYLADINKVMDNYKPVLEQAKKLQERDFEMKHLLYAVNWKSVEESVFERIKLYNNLKNHLDGKEEG